jgi:hypothetical protein
MYSPWRFGSRVGSIGQKLHNPFPALAREDIDFRRGTTVMIAGVPGSFKSVVSLNALYQWALHGVTGMYFSADGDEFTVVRRLAGIVTGDDSSLVESAMVRKDMAKYEAALAELEGWEFEYERFEFEELVVRVKQYETVYGAYPDVLVIDNLINFASSPFAFDEMQSFINDLDGLAKEIKALGLILHHAKLPDINPRARNPRPIGDPPRDDEIQGKMTQYPSVALTIGADNLDLRMACVKNRNGRQYRDASYSIPFTVMPSMRVQARR